ncbi:hypothetical protein GPECTOR_9g696 [Gonium pectorale]|uniref:Uncharacterized protein n=1 Tax=Gonium pectorale TaxID=33097 RepID=A0A150GS67_GONPE|nr:hypothetical protein GPECTOR_9g696 [Gonium pectorale]|eukprot:KXZ52651.1 hypothetical protein GPECTOR_9g696 [Gonium pectorale]
MADEEARGSAVARGGERDELQRGQTPTYEWEEEKEEDEFVPGWPQSEWDGVAAAERALRAAVRMRQRRRLLDAEATMAAAATAAATADADASGKEASATVAAVTAMEDWCFDSSAARAKAVADLTPAMAGLNMIAFGSVAADSAAGSSVVGAAAGEAAVPSAVSPPRNGSTPTLRSSDGSPVRPRLKQDPGSWVDQPAKYAKVAPLPATAAPPPPPCGPHPESNTFDAACPTSFLISTGNCHAAAAAAGGDSHLASVDVPSTVTAPPPAPPPAAACVPSLRRHSALGPLQYPHLFDRSPSVPRSYMSATAAAAAGNTAAAAPPPPLTLLRQCASLSRGGDAHDRNSNGRPSLGRSPATGLPSVISPPLHTRVQALSGQPYSGPVVKLGGGRAPAVAAMDAFRRSGSIRAPAGGVCSPATAAAGGGCGGVTSPQRVGGMGVGGTLAGGASALDRYAALTAASPGWKYTALYDKHDAMLLARLSSARISQASAAAADSVVAAAAITSGGGPDGGGAAAAGSGLLYRMGTLTSSSGAAAAAALQDSSAAAAGSARMAPAPTVAARRAPSLGPPGQGTGTVYGSPSTSGLESPTTWCGNASAAAVAGGDLYDPAVGYGPSDSGVRVGTGQHPISATGLSTLSSAPLPTGLRTSNARRGRTSLTSGGQVHPDYSSSPTHGSSGAGALAAYYDADVATAVAAAAADAAAGQGHDGGIAAVDAFGGYGRGSGFQLPVGNDPDMGAMAQNEGLEYRSRALRLALLAEGDAEGESELEGATERLEQLPSPFSTVHAGGGGAAAAMAAVSEGPLYGEASMGQGAMSWGETLEVLRQQAINCGRGRTSRTSRNTAGLAAMLLGGGGGTREAGSRDAPAVGRAGGTHGHIHAHPGTIAGGATASPSTPRSSMAVGALSASGGSPYTPGGGFGSAAQEIEYGAVRSPEYGAARSPERRSSGTGLLGLFTRLATLGRRSQIANDTMHDTSVTIPEPPAAPEDIVMSRWSLTGPGAGGDSGGGTAAGEISAAEGATMTASRPGTDQWLITEDCALFEPCDSPRASYNHLPNPPRLSSPRLNAAQPDGESVYNPLYMVPPQPEEADGGGPPATPATHEARVTPQRPSPVLRGAGVYPMTSAFTPPAASGSWGEGRPSYGAVPGGPQWLSAAGRGHTASLASAEARSVAMALRGSDPGSTEARRARVRAATISDANGTAATAVTDSGGYASQQPSPAPRKGRGASGDKMRRSKRLSLVEWGLGLGLGSFGFRSGSTASAAGGGATYGAGLGGRAEGGQGGGERSNSMSVRRRVEEAEEAEAQRRVSREARPSRWRRFSMVALHHLSELGSRAGSTSSPGGSPASMGRVGPAASSVAASLLARRRLNASETGSPPQFREREGREPAMARRSTHAPAFLVQQQWSPLADALLSR